MRGTTTVRSRRLLFPIGQTGLLVTALLVAAQSSGCGRALHIKQDEYVNTAMHRNRAPAERTGEPLEINIVVVTPKDLEMESNSRLAPGSGITSETWFANRPQHGDTAEMDDRGGRFWLPKDQIYLLTYDQQYYGNKLGDPLRGEANDKKSEIVKEFEPAGSLHDSRSAIYVFGKFIGPQKEVLPVPPATFSPPGKYGKDLYVKVGVDEDRPRYYGQYIDNVTNQ